ncbi:hypothetical protein ACWC5F_27570 [Streptomyces sp. NPDC001272]
MAYLVRTVTSPTASPSSVIRPSAFRRNARRFLISLWGKGSTAADFVIESSGRRSSEHICE